MPGTCSQDEQMGILYFLVEVTRLELATPCSQSTYATNCATPRYGGYYICFDVQLQIKDPHRIDAGLIFPCDCNYLTILIFPRKRGSVKY